MEDEQSREQKNPSETEQNESSSQPPRLYHTLTACTRCRLRKTRCDAGLPKCGPCERSHQACEFFDSGKQQTISRSYVVHLQKRVRELEEEVKMREALLIEAETPNSEELVRGVGAVRFGDYEHYQEPRYVGSSSGVTVTRLVLESAKQNLEPDVFRDMTFQHRNTFKNAVRSETSDAQDTYCAPAAKLPNREIGMKLIQIFCKKALFMLPILHEPTFLRDVEDVYNGSTDPFKNFQLDMVLAISLQKYNSQYDRLADSYFLAGLQLLHTVMEPMDHRTLQSLLVMVQYALVKPTRIAAYHMVGLCVRLCIQLGYHQERTIMLSESPIDPITKDMRRRIFWTIASMEYGLSHVLGRPSAFATADAYVDVKFYEPVDDECITAGGILPGPLSAKKLISMHFFGMRRLQAEIRQTLYQNPRETPKNDDDPWFEKMQAKCDHWKASCPQDDQGSGLSVIWFEHRYNSIILFMYRPSPQVPQPSLKATLICYDTAVRNVYVEKRLYEEKLAEFTWVFLHQIYTVTLTIIWTLYNPHIRQLHPREEVESHINVQLSLLTQLADLWPGTEAAADLFARLAGAALRNYEKDEKGSSKDTSQSPASVAASLSSSSQQRDHNSDGSGSVYSPDNHSSPYNPSESSRSFGDVPSPQQEQYGSHQSSMSPNYLPQFNSSLLQDPLGPFPIPQQPAEQTLQDMQHMIFDPAMMQAIYGQSFGQTDGTMPEYLSNWVPPPITAHPPDPYAPPPASSSQSSMPDYHNQYPPPMASSSGSRSGGGGGLYHPPLDAQPVLNPTAQQEELMRILEAEQMQNLEAEGSRAWAYENIYFNS